jgi:hypothetical protein
MATGHGVGVTCDGGVLINTSRMRGVRVDPAARTARIEAGALWTDLVHEFQPHGLAGLSYRGRRADARERRRASRAVLEARGRGGYFGFVTSLEFDLYPVGTLNGGDLIYPMEKAAEMVGAYAR